MAEIKKVLKLNDKTISKAYDDITPAVVDNEESNTIFVTKENGLYGFVRISEGKLPCTDNIYTSISNFENGVAIVSRFSISHGKQYGIIDKNLYECLKCKYNEITKLSDVLYKIRGDDKYALYKVGYDGLILPLICSHISCIEDKECEGDMLNICFK